MVEQETKIIFNHQVGEKIYLLGLHSPEILASAEPGQFVMLRIQPGIEPLLRRPFSICGHQGEKTLLILYRVAGRGTSILAEKANGQILSLLGPLGRGFQHAESRVFPVLIGGGMGLAPLLYLARSFTPNEFLILAGFASKNEGVPFEKILGSAPPLLSVSTDDGSLGFKGLVTDLFQEHLASLKKRSERIKVYACGPVRMLHRIVRICASERVTCRVSLETHMACGLGACLGCAVKAARGTGRDYYHVCKDGPVFAAEDIDWASMV